MKIFNNIESLQDALYSYAQESYLKQDEQEINFVPTMGNLHQGHIDLVKKANALSGFTVVSIFVNPLQFDQASDLNAYPRTLDDDIAKLEAEGVAFLFTPTIEEIYPEFKFAKQQLSQTLVCVSDLAKRWEGESRPGHFNGMATIVTKLFNIVQPDRAIFGQKDFQQLQIIRQMVQDLNLPIQIIAMPTTRETDGLAMSSRNSRLASDAREKAPKLYEALSRLKDNLISGKIQVDAQLKQTETELTKLGFELEYITLVEQETLEPIRNQSEKNSVLKNDSDSTDRGSNYIILVAAVLGKVRLIDNLILA